MKEGVLGSVLLGVKANQVALEFGNKEILFRCPKKSICVNEPRNARYKYFENEVNLAEDIIGKK